MDPIDFTDGTWLPNFSELNKRFRECGCEVTYIAGAGSRPPCWIWTHFCGEHKEAGRAATL